MFEVYIKKFDCQFKTQDPQLLPEREFWRDISDNGQDRQRCCLLDSSLAGKGHSRQAMHILLTF